MKYRFVDYRIMNHHQIHFKAIVARSEMLWPATIFLTLFLFMARVWLQQRGAV